MNAADYRAARGSLAGTSFHELWALSQAMKLLDTRTGVTAVSVEGVGPEKSAEQSTDYDGVDCTVLYGSVEVGEADQIEIIQLKYSGSEPHAKWNLSRLAKSDKKTGNNSVLRRLADAYRKIRSSAKVLPAIRLISNQSVSEEVVSRLSVIARTKSQASEFRAKFLKATGLKLRDLKSFAHQLDLTSRTGSRFEIEDKLLLEIASWTDDDARAIRENLLNYIRKQMLPENVGRFLTRENILGIISGTPAEESIFPCPPDLAAAKKVIVREAAKELANRLMSGTSRICLHGGAGSGKTTVIQQVSGFLPDDSAVFIFDCYGAGRYLDASRKRHLAQDAFRQLCNEIAVGLSLPLFLTRSEGPDARSFAKRLKVAAETLRILRPAALLLIGIDAADNSLTAATHFRERSFVEDLISFQELPDNVRLVLSCRSGRVKDLQLPSTFLQQPLTGFTRAETEDYVHGFLPHMSSAWIDDFHALSDGVPRVQQYAIQNGIDLPQGPLSLLQPSGKTLNLIFESIFDDALRKLGVSQLFDTFCASLIALPRPIPLNYCARLCNIPEETILDLCRDLSPGLRLEESTIAFADEDIEAYVWQRAKGSLGQVRSSAADLLLGDHESTDYAATHVAMSLYLAGRKRNLLDIIEKAIEPKVIVDPLRRREVQLQRVKLGVHLANDLGDTAFAVRAVLSGAEAVKTDDAILSLFLGNLDLAASFAEESVRRRVLLDRDQMERHGALIAALMLKSALAQQPTVVRSYRRQYRAWLDRRDLEAPSRESDHFDYTRKWDITAEDIATLVEATFLSEGPEAGIATLASWRPRRVALDAGEIFIPRLLARGRLDLIEPLLRSTKIPAIFRAFIIVPLVRAGYRADPQLFAEILRDRFVQRIVVTRNVSYGRESREQYQFLEKFLFLCELSLKKYSQDAFLLKLIGRLSAVELRKKGRLFDHDTELLNILVRAYCLECAADGHTPTSKEFLLKEEGEKPPEDDHERHRLESLQTVVSLLIDFARARLQILHDVDNANDASRIRETVSQLRNQVYRLQHMYRNDFLKLLSTNILDIAAALPIESETLLSIGASLFGEAISPTGYQLLPLYGRAMSIPSLQNSVLAWAATKDAAIRLLQIPASEKVEALTALARLVSPIDMAEASAIFAHAHEATSEIDVDARFQLKTLSSLVEKALPSLTMDEQKIIANALVSISTSAAIRLQNEEGFPWPSIARAIAQAHPGIGLAASARWEDSSYARTSETLPAVLNELKHPLLSTSALHLAFNPLFEEGDLSFSHAGESKAFRQDLCRDTLRFGTSGAAKRLYSALRTVTDDAWIVRLKDAVSMYEREADSDRTAQTEQKAGDPYSAYLTGLELTSTDALSVLLKRGRDAKEYVPADELLLAAQRLVATKDRLKFLEALVSLLSTGPRGSDIVPALEAAKSAWNTPAVTQWFSASIPKILETHLSQFADLIIWDREHGGLDRLLQLAPDRTGIATALIEGIATGLEHFSAGTIYELCDRLYRYIDADSLKIILLPYTQRLEDELPDAQEFLFDTSDIPDDLTEAIGRYLFALMSDVDTRVRWRAAHCVRRLIRYGAGDILQRIAGLWDRTTENNFRAPNTPFYWQAARLWSVATISRVASECQSAVAPISGLLLKVLSDRSYPHPAVKSFAQDTLRTLLATGSIELTDEEQRVVESTNSPSIAREKLDREYSPHHDKTSRQWEFDSMDTIPSWIRPASRIFAKITTDQLADEAERWIIDEWKIDSKYCKWNTEPRQTRYSDRDYDLRSNRHGHSPIVEDYHTYLSWYGLQCAIGSLSQTEPLSKTEYDDGVDEFESQLAREKLTEPPFWLADLLSTRPPESSLWSRPVDIDKWLSDVSEEEFLGFLARGRSREEVIVNGNAEVRCSEFRWNVDVRSALVAPANAIALVRALQTAEEPLEFCLPGAGPDRYGNRCSIDDKTFELEGWVRMHDSDGRFDDHDPMHFGVSRTIASAFDDSPAPCLAEDSLLKWPLHEGIHFSYERWKITGILEIATMKDPNSVHRDGGSSQEWMKCSPS
jgi:hypothetical protein